jgi:hypothetical protein
VKDHYYYSDSYWMTVVRSDTTERTVAIDQATRRTETDDWRTGLDDLHARTAQRFWRSGARERSRRYLSGLLDRVERKNGCQLARSPGGVRVVADGLQPLAA